MKIAIIDGPINFKLLQKNFSNIHYILSVDEYFSVYSNYVTHGTICSSVLISQFEDNLSSGQVEIIYLALDFLDDGFSLDGLISAIRRCAALKVDIVSLSLGTSDRSSVADFINVFNEASIPLIIAAASNDLRITYPAALHEVLGVKRALQGGSAINSWQAKPIDGIEIIAHPDDKTIKIVQQMSGSKSRPDSNSFLVPQVCAYIARIAIRKNIQVGKASVHSLLTEKEVDAKLLPTAFINPKPINDIPVIMLSYSPSEQRHILGKAIDIQKHFETLGYPCSLISDLTISNNFVEGRYSLIGNDYINLLNNYKYMISDSMILLLWNNEKKPLPNDFCVEFCLLKNTVVLAKQILAHFNKEEP